MTRKLLWAFWLSCSVLVAACGGGGRGSTPAPPVPSTPTGLALGNATDTSITVTWTAASDVGGPGIGGYYVFRNTDTSTPIAVVTSGTSFTDTILIPGTAYTYEVAAFDRTAPTPVASALSSALDVGTTGVTPTDVLQVVVDAGPASLANANKIAANTLFATVTLCTPKTNSCLQVDHVQVDTGSVGLQIMAEVFNGPGSPALQALKDPVSGVPLRECVQFADGYSWGSMVVADVQIAGRKLPAMPVHLIGDSAAGTAPADCILPKSENTVADFGANGVLGVGYFLQDCGQPCATAAQPASYYQCTGNTGSTCTASAVAVPNQLQNPFGIGTFAPDNTGIVINLPAVAAPSAFSVTGVLYFGIGTHANNTPGAGVSFLTVDGSGTLYTTYPGFNLEPRSVIDSGSNGYFFTSTSALLKPCTNSFDSTFYCPATSMGANATIQGFNGVSKPAAYTVDNSDQLFAVYGTAFPNLAGPNSVSGKGAVNSFDWGLPFFFNRTVYVLFENGAIPGTATPGPAVGF